MVATKREVTGSLSFAVVVSIVYSPERTKTAIGGGYVVSRHRSDATVIKAECEGPISFS